MYILYKSLYFARRNILLFFNFLFFINHLVIIFLFYLFFFFIFFLIFLFLIFIFFFISLLAFFFLLFFLLVFFLFILLLLLIFFIFFLSSIVIRIWRIHRSTFILPTFISWSWSWRSMGFLFLFLFLLLFLFLFLFLSLFLFLLLFFILRFHLPQKWFTNLIEILLLKFSNHFLCCSWPLGKSNTDLQHKIFKSREEHGSRFIELYK